MKIIVNDTELELHGGARVRDAIARYYKHAGRKVPKRLPVAEDKYGNIVAPDGALTDGNTLFILSSRKKRTRLIRLIIVILAAGILPACSTTRHTGASPDARVQTAVSSPAERQAVIFAVNDMHAAIDNFPKLAWIVDSLRNIYPDMLLVAAGDNQTGNPVNDQYPEKGFPVIDLMNTTGFNLSAVGNHEFDTGPGGFGILTQKAHFPFICANVTVDSHPGVRITPYKTITLPNGLRLAFLGLIQLGQNGIPDSHPDNVRGFSFRSPFETAPGYLWLKDSSDVFIALTHIGFEEDVKLAETMPPGIDLIIGGHSHTRVAKEQIHNGIMITQAESKLKYGTLIILAVNSAGAISRSMQLVDIRNSKNENQAIRAMVDKYNDNPVLNEVIATAADDFSSSGELGYLMADAQRAAAGADIALMNPGGVRIDRLAKGPVTIKDVYQLDPFGNELVVTRLTGTEIYSLLHAAWPVDENHPVYPSGITTEHSVDAEGNLKVIIVLTEDGLPLEKSRLYTVAMNSYMTQVYNYEHADPGQSLFFTTADALITYLKKHSDLRSYRGETRVKITR
ncbi:MAG: bifunctional metallophosphatase/5'-nucleotidase [Bacteroidales bacterium]|nr:bifunctional metallophosphatase/5'-nucleotidase [Bacteroidales bacterium]